ncbi:nitric oxide reductase NorD protein [uncultured Thiomicrorhabdus sp.]
MAYCVQLNQIQRQLELTLYALWGKPFNVLPLSEGEMAPKIQEGVIYLPSVISADTAVLAEEQFLCSALHAAAHDIYSIPSDSSGLNNRQLVLISLFEDARVEYLASLKFNGIQRLFSQQFKKQPSSSFMFDELLYAIAFSLINKVSDDSHPLVCKAVTLFYQSVNTNVHNPDLFRSAALAIANDIGQMRISMNETKEFVLCSYRDDNAYLWRCFDEVSSVDSEQGMPRDSVSVTGVAYQEVEDGSTVADFDDREAVVSNGLVFQSVEHEAQSSLRSLVRVTGDYQYPEWDYKIARWKTGWCTLQEKVLRGQHSGALQDKLEQYRPFINKLLRIVQSYQAQMHRMKKQEEGVELDFDAIIDLMAELRTGASSAESKIYIDHLKQHRQEVALLVLIDLSESMNDLLDEGDKSVLDLTKDSTVVLSELLDGLGHAYAIHGFNSNGRGDVSYLNIKDFEQTASDALVNLSSVTAEYSTRLGAALRHARHKIENRDERHKLILVITDGQPSDIDVYDDKYLIEDAAMAVKLMEASGCRSFCLSLDKDADDYVQRIFRKGHYEVVEHPSKLPQILMKLYLNVFKSIAV